MEDCINIALKLKLQIFASVINKREKAEAYLRASHAMQMVDLLELRRFETVDFYVSRIIVKCDELFMTYIPATSFLLIEGSMENCINIALKLKLQIFASAINKREKTEAYLRASHAKQILDLPKLATVGTDSRIEMDSLGSIMTAHSTSGSFPYEFPPMCSNFQSVAKGSCFDRIANEM
ncbi:hypothetical protein ACLB2K_041320 [Fragaria x ananassa]